MDIRALIKEEVLAQKAYPVDNASCRIKLDANENPLAMPGAAPGAIRGACWHPFR